MLLLVFVAVLAVVAGEVLPTADAVFKSVGDVSAAVAIAFRR